MDITFKTPLIFGIILNLFPTLTQAQIVPDTTLPRQTSVTSEGNTIRIEGGTQAGSNLFHSFQEFSVNSGTTAFFNNAVDIQNIISRITGKNASLIDGFIQANGTANLFLLNPNGIIFGPNAQLNIEGSFIGSTANRLLFNDGSSFSATPGSTPPLLTVNVPIGLQFGGNPGVIVNQSQAVGIGLDGNPAITGLQVQPGQTLSLIGGDLTLDNGYLTAFDGRVELGSVRNSVWQLGVGTSATSQRLGQVQLSRQSQVDTSGNSGGTIQVQGRTVRLTGGSRLLANTFGTENGGGIDLQASELTVEQGSFVSASTFGTGTGGGIRVNADTVELTGTAPGELTQQLLDRQFDPFNLTEGLYSLSGGEGTAGAITINANQLQVRDGAGILTTALAEGEGGNLSLNISQLTQLSNVSLIVTGTAGAGEAGDLNIATNQLRVLDGTTVTTTSISISESDAANSGTLTVNADTVELRGTPVEAEIPGGLFTATLGNGNAGNLTVNTRHLIVADGTQISSSASGAGEGGNLRVNAETVELSGISPDGRFLSGLLTSSSLLTVEGEEGTAGAGNLMVQTERLVVRDGAQISTATGGQGAAGNLNINATESVEVRGIATNADPSVEEVSFGVTGDGIIPSAIESNTSGEGTAGTIRIETNQLTVRDGAEIGVRGTMEGAAGNLEIVAGSIQLDNQGAISAATASGSQGNIRLQADRIELRQGSRITTNSGSADGGNITINTDTLVALENSDITANAQQGRGGRVRINAQGVFGTAFRERQTSESDITATSELGAEFSGAVDINRPETDPNSALAELPAIIIDPTTLVVLGCASYAGSEFTITGRGGLPLGPNDTLSSDGLIVNWIEPQPHRTQKSEDTENTTNTLPLQQNPPLVEAQGWIIQADGTVELVVLPTTGTPNGSGFVPRSCPDRS